MSTEYIHVDDAYAWLRDKEVQFAEQDFAKVQAERDKWRGIAAGLYIAGNMKWGWKDAAKAYEEGMNND
jgi:hypothetical protein